MCNAVALKSTMDVTTDLPINSVLSLQGDVIGRPYESGICLGRSDEVGAKHPPSLICPNRSPTSRVSHLSPSVNTLFCLILTVPTFFGEK